MKVGERFAGRLGERSEFARHHGEVLLQGGYGCCPNVVLNEYVFKAADRSRRCGQKYIMDISDEHVG